MTALEIIDGILNNTEASTRSLVFIREIDFDEENQLLIDKLKEKKMLNNDEQDDKEVESLKNQIRSNLCEENIFELKVFVKLSIICNSIHYFFLS